MSKRERVGISVLFSVDKCRFALIKTCRVDETFEYND